MNKLKQGYNYKLVFFDCDGTLINTALPESGKLLWEQHHGKPYPHKGWWGREESLDVDVFPNNYKSEVYDHYQKMKDDGTYLMYVLTSREPKLKHIIEKILQKHDLQMIDVLCKKGNYTKGQHIDQMIKYYHDQQINIEQVIMFEDRNKEIATIEPYRQIWKELGTELIIYKIQSDAQD